MSTTHAQISHLIASLPISRQQVVFALHVLSCQQVWNKLLTTFNSLVHIIRLVARLFQQVRYSPDITIFLQPCIVNLVTFLLYHDCIRLIIVLFVETPRKFITAKLSIRKPGSSSVLIICQERNESFMKALHVMKALQ